MPVSRSIKPGMQTPIAVASSRVSDSGVWHILAKASMSSIKGKASIERQGLSCQDPTIFSNRTRLDRRPTDIDTQIIRLTAQRS